MKLKTLAWTQIVIGVIIFLKVFSVVTGGEQGIFYQLGSEADMILLTLFVLLTGIYNLKQKK